MLKKAHKHLFFLRRLTKFGMSPSILRSFYTYTVESILTGCITAWFGNSTAGNRKSLQAKLCCYQANEHSELIVTVYFHFTVCHALHFNFNAVKFDYTHTLHKFKNLVVRMHIHDIFVLSLCIICCTFAYYCVYICVHNVECVHTVYNVY